MVVRYTPLYKGKEQNDTKKNVKEKETWERRKVQRHI
jgi:hypothetical protein